MAPDTVKLAELRLLVVEIAPVQEILPIPVKLVIVPPNATGVVPMVIALLIKPELGIPVMLVPVKTGVFVQLGAEPPTNTCVLTPPASIAVVLAAV